MISAISESWHRKTMIRLAKLWPFPKVGTEEGLLIVLSWMNRIVQQELSWGSTHCRIPAPPFSLLGDKRHQEAVCPSKLGGSRPRRSSVVCQGNKGDTFRHLLIFHPRAGAAVNTINHIFILLDNMCYFHGLWW